MNTPPNPAPEPGTLTTLHPVHIQTVENLVAKVYDYAAGNAQIEHLKQQAESVATIMERLKAGTLKGPDSVKDGMTAPPVRSTAVGHASLDLLISELERKLPDLAAAHSLTRPGWKVKDHLEEIKHALQAEGIDTTQASKEWLLFGPSPTVTTPSAVPNNPPMVKLTWRDSAQPIVGWRFTDDLPPLRSVLCESIGYVVAEDGENIMLAQSIGDRNEKNQQANACMVIPRCCIVERVTLGLAILHAHS